SSSPARPRTSSRARRSPLTAATPSKASEGDPPMLRGGRHRGLGGSALGLVILLIAASAAGQGADPRAEMPRTVLDQLAAFRRDDWAGAYSYAASTIQARFGLEAFRQMVSSGYAEIARSVRATVSHVEMIDADHGLVEVRVDGANGQTVDALYELVDEQG